MTEAEHRKLQRLLEVWRDKKRPAIQRVAALYRWYHPKTFDPGFIQDLKEFIIK